MLTRIMFLIFVLYLPLVQAAPMRVLQDMAGNSVTVPERVERIATIGAVPVLNSLIFAIGEGRSIVNGLPEFAKKPRWGYQTVFAPHIALLDSLQNHDRTANIESVLRVAPDVVLSMDRITTDALRRAGLPALYLNWRQPGDIKAAVRLLGQLFHKPEAAERYAKYFDTILAQVSQKLRNGASARPSVLFFSPATLTQPHLVAEWWIRSAGGESVTNDSRSVESRSFTMEQLLAWNPDIMIVSGYEEADAIRREPRFSGLKAVRAGKILVAPCGAHTWGNRTAEQPLTVLWAAKQFHPKLFADIDLMVETRRFYHEFFGITITQSQATEILAGGPRTMQIAK
ncbi:MAG: iron complex transport system substrate-binding protein [Candidatus Nitrotoga sp. SPKER]|nr:MAG: iron complex transport system substrate-binding protein [Candidatus Nitrotoga sp. SPKER]